MKLQTIFIILMLLLFSYTSKSNERQILPVQSENIDNLKPYSELKAETLNKREIFRKEYEAHKRDKQKQETILTEAQRYLLENINEYFKAWYNTPWTFHGHSQTPQKGSIACGYFITTTLRDIGFNIPRVKWAQQASEYLIKKLSTDIKRFQKKPMRDIIDYISSTGEGLYIVGLDCHVGYIYYQDGKMSFVHANYYKPQIGVMNEPLTGHNPLNNSKYRVIGKIFEKEMVLNWILNTPYSE